MVKKVIKIKIGDDKKMTDKIIRFQTDNKEYDNIELRWNIDKRKIELIKYTNKFQGFIENVWNFVPEK